MIHGHTSFTHGSDAAQERKKADASEIRAGCSVPCRLELVPFRQSRHLSMHNAGNIDLYQASRNFAHAGTPDAARSTCCNGGECYSDLIFHSRTLVFRAIYSKADDRCIIKPDIVAADEQM